MLLRSPVHDRHEALGAKFAAFGGWEMPLEYAGGGVIAEHTAVRTDAGVFDVSHLGKATVTGPGAADFVNACLTNDLGRIRPGKAQYTLCCDDATGGVVDDLIAYLNGPDDVFLAPNAANTAEVVRRLTAAAPPGVTVRDAHQAYAILAVQGPRSADVL
jgi:aminomethyltransferase